jgi:hypothetical protein
VAIGWNPGGAVRAADGPLVLDVWPGRPAGEHGARARTDDQTDDEQCDESHGFLLLVGPFGPLANLCPGRAPREPGGTQMSPRRVSSLSHSETL